MELAREPRRHEGMFGGHGVVRVWDLLAGRSTPPFRDVASCELEPGARIGRHRDEHADEILIVMSGRGEVSVDDRARTIEAGAVVHHPMGSTLEVVNASPDEPLRYVSVKARATRRAM